MRHRHTDLRRNPRRINTTGNYVKREILILLYLLYLLYFIVICMVYIGFLGIGLSMMPYTEFSDVGT